uniref:CCHC-type domain-containing protein n=1 Tax=Cajanus cajan TaxID=3821 RepID=A0A151RSM7_CAJCA|nr:hypothetical protein KK1_032902 [Cajanus cajan]
MQFLRGLNEQYSNVRSHVLLMDPRPEISKIFSYAAKQERQLLGNDFTNSTNIDPKGSMINVVNSSSFVCNFCGRTGHTKNACYRKHGFPSNHEGKNKRIYNKGRKTCTHGGKVGHTIDVCYRKHGFPPGHKFYSGKSTINNIVKSDSKIIDDQQQNNESQEIRFSPQQYQALLALIQKPYPGN